MERYLIIKTRDELLRIKIGQILYFEADRNYTKLLLSNGIQFTFAINIGKIEELLETQVAGSNAILMRVGKSHIINKNSQMKQYTAASERKYEHRDQCGNRIECLPANRYSIVNNHAG